MPHRSIIDTLYCPHHALIFANISLFQVQDNNDALSYWLSNLSTLLVLLQRTLKASGTTSLTPQRRRSTSASLFGRMSQVSNSFQSLKHLDMHIVLFNIVIYLFYAYRGFELLLRVLGSRFSAGVCLVDWMT